MDLTKFTLNTKEKSMDMDYFNSLGSYQVSLKETEIFECEDMWIVR